LPSRRFSSAQEFRLALENYLRSNGFNGGPEQLKELMTKHYDAEQREIRRTIEEHLATARSRSSRPPQSSEYVPEIPRDSRVPQFEGGQPLVSGLIPPGEELEWETPRKKSRVWLAAGVAAGVAVVGAALLIAKTTNSGGRPAPTVSSSEPRKPEITSQQTDVRPSAESLWVTLSAVPNDAEIRLDGRRVSNPYRAAHGRDAVAHHVTVSLSGYQTLEREVWFAHDVELRFSLDPAPSGETRTTKTPSAAVRRAATAVATPQIANPSPPALPTVPAAEQKPGDPRPGDDLRGLDPRATKARSIDETDPYKR
jgi:hypothetical protein